MKVSNIYIIALGIIVSLLSSCNFLDKEPTSTTSGSYFKNESEAELFLKGIYAPITETAFYGNDYFYLIGGDDLEAYGGPGRSPSTRGLICNNANSSDPAVAAYWYTLYAGINRANIFLEEVNGVPGLSESMIKTMSSEARFLRAFYYFNLVQCWGDVPFRTHSTQSVYGLQTARTPKEEIYDFICKEMEESVDGLKHASEVSFLPGGITKSVAWGILARVYMFRAGECFRDHTTPNEALRKDYFTKAGAFAQRVMNEGHTLAPHYWDFFIDQCSDKYNTTGKESIWEAEYTGNYSTDTRTEGRVGNIIGIQAPDLSSKTDITGKLDPGFGYCFFWSTPKLYELYEKNGDKDRMNWNIAPFSYTQSKVGKGVDGRVFEKGKLQEVKNQYYNQSYSYGDMPSTAKTGDREKAVASTDYSRMCGKWRREYEPDKKNKNFTLINFPILRYSDVLLMVAECENEIHGGPTTLAYQCINMVRQRAGIATLTGLNQEDFRNAIKDERAMELCFEMTRRFDLIRWGDFTKDMNALVERAKNGTNWNFGPSNVYTYFQVSDAYNYFPIPSNEMAINKKIVANNPGW
jgi:outer membrane protein